MSDLLLTDEEIFHAGYGWEDNVYKLGRNIAKAQHDKILKELKKLDKSHSCCKDFDNAIQDLIIRME